MRKETIGNSVLYLGDCVEVLPTLPPDSVETVVTDIPFNVNKSYGVYNDFLPIPEYQKFINGVLAEIKRISKDKSSIFVKVPTKHLPALMTCGLGGLNYKWTMGIYVPNSMKPISNGFNQLGLVLWLYKSEPLKTKWANDAIKINRLGNVGDSLDNHPNPMDEIAVLWLIDSYSHEGDTVFDPFMGTGTTGVACAKTGRRFVGIEIEQKWFDVACKRVEEAQMQLRLF